MSSNRARKNSSVQAVARELGAIATQSILLNQAVAERLGLHATEVEALDLLARAGPLTAGQISEITGLTSGATSRLIDRLERAGYARRTPNPADRRSVLVAPVAEAFQERVAPLYTPLEQALEDLYERFNEEQLEVIRTFLSGANAATREHLKRLRGR